MRTIALALGLLGSLAAGGCHLRQPSPGLAPGQPPTDPRLQGFRGINGKLTLKLSNPNRTRKFRAAFYIEPPASFRLVWLDPFFNPVLEVLCDGRFLSMVESSAANGEMAEVPEDADFIPGIPFPLQVTEFVNILLNLEPSGVEPSSTTPDGETVKSTYHHIRGISQLVLSKNKDGQTTERWYGDEAGQSIATVRYADFVMSESLRLPKVITIEAANGETAAIEMSDVQVAKQPYRFAFARSVSLKLVSWEVFSRQFDAVLDRRR